MHQSFREGFEKTAAWISEAEIAKTFGKHYLKNTLLGAGAGATVGALGADEGHRSQSALKGALIGGLGGAGMSGISHLIRGRPMGAGMARRDWLDFMPEVDSAIFMPAISASGGALLGAATAEEGDRARAALLGGALGAGAGYGLHRGGLIRKEIKKMPDSRRAWKNLKELQKITKKHPRKYPVAQYLTENSGISEPSAFNRFLERHPQVEKALIDNIEPIGAGLGALAAGGAYSLADSFMQ